MLSSRNYEAEELDENIEQLQTKKRQVTRVVICAVRVPSLFGTNYIWW